MRFVQAALFLAVMTSPALAQREPQIVIPGRADVPVIINGINASWGVVVGEFGLDRPGEMAPVVIYQPLLLSTPYYVPSYFPKDGKKPGYGRLEINPPRGSAAAAAGADLLSQLVEPIRRGSGDRIPGLSDAASDR